MQAQPRNGVKTALTWASVLWHCRFFFEADREKGDINAKS
jgi:hypothetical protein